METSMILNAMMIVKMNASDKRNETMVAIINANNYDNHDYTCRDPAGLIPLGGYGSISSKGGFQLATIIIQKLLKEYPSKVLENTENIFNEIKSKENAVNKENAAFAKMQ